MKKTSLSDDIRRLEELRDEGFLSEKQYLRELHEAMGRHEQEIVPDAQTARADDTTVGIEHVVVSQRDRVDNLES